MSQPSAPCRTLAIALLVTISASAPSVARWTPAGVQSATLLEVRNDRWDDLTVYLEREGSLFKLGTVRGLSTRVLEVPAAYLHNRPVFASRPCARGRSSRRSPFRSTWLRDNAPSG